MALCGNTLLCNDHRITDGAVLALGLASGGAGSCYGFIDHFGMPQCIAFGGAASLTLLCSSASCCIPTVALCSNALLGNDHRITDGAMLTFGLTGSGASSSYSLVDDFGMTQCVTFSCAAGLTLLCGGAGCSIPAVTLCVNGLLSNNHRITDGAVLALGLASGGAGSCYGLIGHFVVALCRNNLRVSVTTTGTSIQLFTGCCTGSLGSNHTGIIRTNMRCICATMEDDISCIAVVIHKIGCCVILQTDGHRRTGGCLILDFERQQKQFTISDCINRIDPGNGVAGNILGQRAAVRTLKQLAFADICQG